MDNLPTKPAFSTAEFALVLGLVLGMAGVFITTSNNLRIEGSLLNRTPAVGTPEELPPLYRAPQGNVGNVQVYPSEQTSSSSGNTIINGHCHASFRLEKDGGLTPEATVRLAIRALGSESTFGYRGPKVGVHASISLDNGTTWRPLFSLKDIHGGEEEHLSDIPGGSRILIRFEGRYGWSFQKEITTGSYDPHSIILQPGDIFPAALSRKPFLKPFLKNILDANERVIGNDGDIFVLTELGDIDAHADFQDAVLQMQVESQACDALIPLTIP